MPNSSSSELGVCVDEENAKESDETKQLHERPSIKKKIINKTDLKLYNM